MTTRADAVHLRSKPLSDAWWLFMVVALLLAYVLIAVPAHFEESQGGDFPYYVQIAASPLDNSVPAPWRYRLLNPLMASALTAIGVPGNAAFLALTTTFAFISCLLMRVHLQQLGLSTFGARAGTLLFAVSVGAYIPLRRYYGYTDALTNAFLLLLLTTTAAKRYLPTAVALGFGTLAKESLLLAVPFLAQRWWRVVAFRHVAVLIAVPVTVWLALRAMVGPDPSGSAPAALTLAAQLDYWQTAMVHGPVRWLLWAFAYSFGPVWLLAAVAFRQNLGFLRTTWLYAIPIVAPLARTTDTERALMLLFPIVIPLAAHAIESCHQHRRAVLIAAMCIGSAWLAQLTFDWTPQLRMGAVNAKDLTFLALCVLPAATVLACRTAAGQQTSLRWERSHE